MRSSFPALRKKFWVSSACAVAFAFSLFAALPSCAHGQDFADHLKWEVGGHYAFLNLPSQCTAGTMCDSKENGLGANLTYNFSGWIGFDTEMNFFGDNGNTPTATSGGNVTEGLFGFRFGPTTRRWGLYSVVRPGFVTFSRVLTPGPAPMGSGAAIFPAAASSATSSATTGGIAPPQFSARLNYQTPASSNPLAVLGLTSATDFAFNYGEVIEYRPTKHAALRFDVGDTIVAFPGSSLGTPFHQHNFQISQAIVIRF